MRLLRLLVLTAVLGLTAAPAVTACSGSFMPAEPHQGQTVSPQPPESPEPPEGRTLVLATTGGGALLLTGAAVLALRRTGVA
jgi:hypothetical protein